MKLVLSGINKSFGSNHVLKDIAFTAESGKALGLLGRNGSGKTTTIRVIMDIFPSDSGTVTIDGVSNKKSKVRIGYLPEERGLYPKRLISDQMTYFGQLRGLTAQEARDNAKVILKKLEAEEYYGKKLETLSKGNQQKIQLAIAVINNPDIVILDEPFSGLDPVNAILLKKLVEDMAKQGKIVLFSSHQMNYVEEFCDDVCIINKGRIVMDGSLRKIKKSYPRNNIIISVDEAKAAALKKAMLGDSALKTAIEKIEAVPEGLIVSLAGVSGKSAVFSSPLLSSFDVDGVRVIEPSLEQIFIEKAGDSDEAVS